MPAKLIRDQMEDIAENVRLATEGLDYGQVDIRIRVHFSGGSYKLEYLGVQTIKIAEKVLDKTGR